MALLQISEPGDPLPPHERKLAVGIDLGTTNSLVATDSALPFDFLERQLERREAAAHAQDAGDTDALEALLTGVRADCATLERRLAALLDADRAWDEARMRVRELKFLGKLAADIDGMLGELEA